MSYKQLTQEQRYHIWALKKAGFNRTAMAKELGVHKSTLPKGHPPANCAATQDSAAIAPSKLTAGPPAASNPEPGPAALRLPPGRWWRPTCVKSGVPNKSLAG
jgi:hypothetical protein